MKSLRVNGVDLHYFDHGSGLPLLLVHGFPLDHTMWTGQLDGLISPPREFLLGEAFLSEETTSTKPTMPIRIVAPDLRGLGRSKSHDENVTMEQFADDLAALLDGLGITEPVVVCGLSMGGYVAFQFWRRHASRLRALILCDTRASGDTPEAKKARYETIDRVLREGPQSLVESMSSRLFAESTQRLHPDMVEELERVMMSSDPRGIAAASRGMAERPDMTPMLGQITCPTLVLVGQSDMISPPNVMRSIAEGIPNARYVEIPAAGHMAPLENPAAVNSAIVDFLASL